MKQKDYKANMPGAHESDNVALTGCFHKDLSMR